MIDANLVWYLCYGSNIFEDRFLCYITGGQPAGSQRRYAGCRDKSLPKDNKPKIINYELYFAEQSSVWDNSGVGFVSIDKNQEAKTFSKMYLLTKQQLADIAKQETNSENYLEINLEEAILNGNTIFKNPSWYGNMIFLGYDSGYPIFTLTNKENLQTSTKPSEEYLKTIIKGLHQTYNVTRKEIVDYFIDKRGVDGNYSLSDLQYLNDNGQ